MLARYAIFVLEEMMCSVVAKLSRVTLEQQAAVVGFVFTKRDYDGACIGKSRNQGRF